MSLNKELPILYCPMSLGVDIPAGSDWDIELQGQQAPWQPEGESSSHSAGSELYGHSLDIDG